MAASGAVALYYVDGLTPQVDQVEAESSIRRTFVVDDLQPGYRALQSGDGAVDLVWLGCPHAGLADIAAVADLLGGRHVVSALWITTARETRHQAAAHGYVRAIEAAGGRVVADMCVAIAPMHELGYRTIATPSAKGAHYAVSHAGLRVYFGSLARCVEAAICGTWR
jgi:predicted aconitase